jgi:hypothetical protein
VLDGPALASFDRERERLDNIMARKITPRVASTAAATR